MKFAKSTVVLLIGVHPDESAAAKILQNELSHMIALSYDEVNVINISLSGLSEFPQNCNNRFRDINGVYYDLNRVGRKCTITEKDALTAVSLLKNSTEIPANLLGSWLEQCEQVGININAILRGSQPYVSGFFGFVDSNVKRSYHRGVIECAEHIDRLVVGNRRIILVDIHAGMGKCGEISVAYHRVQSGKLADENFFIEDLMKCLESRGRVCNEVLILELGTSTSYTHMTDVLLEVKGYLEGTEYPRREIVDVKLELIARESLWKHKQIIYLLDKTLVNQA